MKPQQQQKRLFVTAGAYVSTSLEDLCLLWFNSPSKRPLCHILGGILPAVSRIEHIIRSTRMRTCSPLSISPNELLEREE